MASDFTKVLKKHNNLPRVLKRAVQITKNNSALNDKQAEKELRQQIVSYEEQAEDPVDQLGQTFTKKFARWFAGQTRPESRTEWEAIFKATNGTFGNTRFFQIDYIWNFTIEVLNTLKEQISKLSNEDVDELNILTMDNIPEILTKRLAIQPSDQVQKILHAVVFARLTKDKSVQPPVFKDSLINEECKIGLQLGDLQVKKDIIPNRVIVAELIDQLQAVINALPELYRKDQEVDSTQRNILYRKQGLQQDEILISVFWKMGMKKQALQLNPKAKDKDFVDQIDAKIKRCDEKVNDAGLPYHYLVRKMQMMPSDQYIPNALSLKSETKYWMGVIAEYLVRLLNLESHFYVNKDGMVFTYDKSKEKVPVMFVK